MTTGADCGGGEVKLPDGAGDDGTAEGTRGRGLGRGRGRAAVDIAVAYKDAIVGKHTKRAEVIHVIILTVCAVQSTKVLVEVSGGPASRPHHPLPFLDNGRHDVFDPKISMSTPPIAFKKRAKPSTRKREVESDATTDAPTEAVEESPITLATKLKKRAKPKSRLSFGADEEVRVYTMCL